MLIPCTECMYFNEIWPFKPCTLPKHVRVELLHREFPVKNLYFPCKGLQWVWKSLDLLLTETVYCSCLFGIPAQNSEIVTIEFWIRILWLKWFVWPLGITGKEFTALTGPVSPNLLPLFWFFCCRYFSFFAQSYSWFVPNLTHIFI